jgi:hypothetical protein
LWGAGSRFGALCLPDLPTAAHQARRLRSPRSPALHLSPLPPRLHPALWFRLLRLRLAGRGEVILAGMRWYLSYPLSARQVAELLAERGIDVPALTIRAGPRHSDPYWPKSHTAIGGGWARAGTWTSSPSAGAARSTTFIEPSISAGGWWMCLYGSATIWPRPKPSSVERSRGGCWSRIRWSAIITSTT